MRIAFILVCVVCAVLGAFFGQPHAAGNSDALMVIITVLSVFAGFMVAVVTIIGDPSMIPEGSWRAAEVRRDSVEAGLIRHVWLFFVYLIAIAFLFCGVLLLDASLPQCFQIWFERTYLFLGIFAFLLTFALPGMLLKMQMGRLDTEIEKRRGNAGIKEHNTDK